MLPALLVIGGAALLVYKIWGDSQAQSAQQQWNHSRRDLEQRIDQHERQLRSHAAHSLQNIQWNHLHNQHIEAEKLAYMARSAVRDAKEARSPLRKALALAIHEAQHRRQLLDDKPFGNSTRSRIQNEILQLEQLASQYQAELDTFQLEVDSLMAKRDNLNQQADSLANNIRDHFGSRGAQWFEQRRLRIDNRKLLATTTRN